MAAAGLAPAGWSLVSEEATVVLVVLSDRVELWGDPTDLLRHTSGDLVAAATPSGDGWSLRWQDGREDVVADRDAVEDALIARMRR